jgi:hypothetical protein
LDEIAKVDGEESGVNWEHWENEEDGCQNSDISRSFFILFKRHIWLISRHRLSASLKKRSCRSRASSKIAASSLSPMKTLPRSPRP